MLRLVETSASSEERSVASDVRADYEECRAYRKLDQLLYRVLQLDEILHRRCAFNAGKAVRIKKQIEEKQEELEQVFTEIDGGTRRRSTMRLVES